MNYSTSIIVSMLAVLILIAAMIAILLFRSYMDPAKFWWSFAIILSCFVLSSIICVASFIKYASNYLQDKKTAFVIEVGNSDILNELKNALTYSSQLNNFLLGIEGEERSYVFRGTESRWFFSNNWKKEEEKNDCSTNRVYFNLCTALITHCFGNVSKFAEAVSSNIIEVSLVFSGEGKEAPTLRLYFQEALKRDSFFSYVYESCRTQIEDSTFFRNYIELLKILFKSDIDKDSTIAKKNSDSYKVLRKKAIQRMLSDMAQNKKVFHAVGDSKTVLWEEHHRKEYLQDLDVIYRQASSLQSYEIDSYNSDYSNGVLNFLNAVTPNNGTLLRGHSSRILLHLLSNNRAKYAFASMNETFGSTISDKLEEIGCKSGKCLRIMRLLMSNDATLEQLIELFGSKEGYYISYYIFNRFKNSKWRGSDWIGYINQKARDLFPKFCLRNDSYNDFLSHDRTKEESRVESYSDDSIVSEYSCILDDIFDLLDRKCLSLSKREMSLSAAIDFIAEESLSDLCCEPIWNTYSVEKRLHVDIPVARHEEAILFSLGDEAAINNVKSLPIEGITSDVSAYIGDDISIERDPYRNSSFLC
ncbi:hypothetical protein AB9K21_02240 [Anaplasma phagocytophilum]|uniref:Uncharacterized protein n=1 Tax=Anaplasma phagocytophilum str. ApNP TaxID=1359153 RepID=A0A0F3NF69_ANAPH|nr:hypothetical protein APHNP_0157 [Anaplasma phagocytophilum str. ApNP]